MDAWRVIAHVAAEVAISRRFRPPLSQTSGGDNRVSFDQPPEPLDTLPQQLTFEEFMEPT